MDSFSKTQKCPSSEELLAFQRKEADDVSRALINEHLGVCEFCLAEVELYEHYQPLLAESAPAAGAIPLPLYDLAIALLQKGRANLASILAPGSEKR